jgi:hypothetical protein
MTELIDFPGKEPNVVAQNPQDVAKERLFAVRRAIDELELVPPEVLASLRFDRIDGRQIGAGQMLRRYGTRLELIRVKLGDCRAAKVPAEVACD